MVLPEEQPVLARLAELAIPYERHEHPPIATGDEGLVHWEGIDAVHCKNLFLRNQKGTRHYLVILPVTKRADLRLVADQVGDGKLSFASAERLRRYLGVTPGSVSPFGLIHDREHHVRVFLDRELKQAARISFHPNINTRTLVLSFADFEAFLASTWNVVRYVEVGRGGRDPDHPKGVNVPEI
jgi:Ala-tRNA(Pro) deacylase